MSDPALGEAWRRLAGGEASDGENVDWVLYGYDQGGTNATKCVVAASGSGVGGLLAALREDQVRMKGSCGEAVSDGGDEGSPCGPVDSVR